MNLYLRKVTHPQAHDNYRVILKRRASCKVGAAGRSIRDIAQARRITEAAVKAVIDHEAEDQLGGTQLRRELLFEVRRLRELGQGVKGSADEARPGLPERDTLKFS